MSFGRAGWTDATDKVCYQMTNMPYGDGQSTPISTCGTATEDTFAMLARDPETGLFDTPNRKYSSTAGRWLTPDPAYWDAVDLSDPSTLNPYTYVNNPVNYVDPDGTSCFGSHCGPGDLSSYFSSSMMGGSSGLGSFAVGEEFRYLTGYSWDDLQAINISGIYYADGGLWFGPADDRSPADDGQILAYLMDSMPTATVTVTMRPPGSAPNNGQEPPPACQAKILNATNNQFGTNFTNSNVTNTFNYSTGAGPGQGTLNLNIQGSMAGVSTGYYPVHWWTYAIGFGSTLHVVGGDVLDSPQTLQFGPNQGTFHIDSGFPYNPIGAFAHWLLNMTKAGGYPKC